MTRLPSTRWVCAILAAWESDAVLPVRPAKRLPLNDPDPMLARPTCGALNERTAADRPMPWLKLTPLPPAPRAPPPMPRALASLSSVATLKRMIAAIPMVGARNADMALPSRRSIPHSNDYEIVALSGWTEPHDRLRHE